MAIVAEREVARADMNDSYGVALWQERKLVDYTTEEARALAAELLRAADEADRVEREDRDAAFASEGRFEISGFDIDTPNPGGREWACSSCRHGESYHGGAGCRVVACDCAVARIPATSGEPQ